ncbi:MAG: stage II sporulation protein R [Oscillospiraceae bacterium]|nr:MAG: stage II sporulation protein R [Oscillospiraceae bacterium]
MRIRQSISMVRADAMSLALAAVLLLSLLGGSAAQFFEQCNQVRGETLRLHIVANSDTDEDQRQKLLVRDALLREYAPLLSQADNVEAAESFAGFLLGAIHRTAEKTLREDGCEDPVTVSLTRMYFDTRTYDEGITLPAGEYTALRVVIGSGGGHNWWCVMYPPLCLPAAVADGEAGRVEREIEALSDQPGYQARFAVVEWAEKLRARFG